MARVPRLACALASVALVACGRPSAETPPTAGTTAPQQAQGDVAPATFHCVGNEPGWMLDIRSDSLVFVGDYGEVRDVFPAVTPRTGEGLWYWEAEKREGDAGFARLVAVVTRDSCSDGMSDRVYGYRARVIYGIKAWIGCAERR